MSELERRDVKRMMESMSVGDLHDLLATIDRLLAENAELRRERNAWQTAHQIIEDSVKRNAKSLAQLDAVLDKNEELRTRLARVEALAREAVGIAWMWIDSSSLRPSEQEAANRLAAIAAELEQGK